MEDRIHVRHLTESDHGRVLAAVDSWWDEPEPHEASERRALMLPRLFFRHFSDTSYVGEDDDRTLHAFLIAFLSPAQPQLGYIHFVGVSPGARRSGIARRLYERFFEHAAAAGAARIQCVVSPDNQRSVAFHRSMGFEAEPRRTPDGEAWIWRDYDGPGLDRVLFSRRI